MDIDSLMTAVKAKMGEIIQKPKMIDKLLQKPPFRFLHDTITAVTNTTGFGDGLYSGEELDSAAITDRQAKVNYLEKIFNLVGICKGSPLDIRAAKVVAGLEPECTNSFLLALANAASDSNIDNHEAVRRCLGGEEPGTGAAPKKRGAARSDAKAEGKQPREERKEAPTDATDSKGSNDGAKSSSQSESKGSRSDMDPPADRGERGQSRGGARGGKPNPAGNDSGLGGFTAPPGPNLDSEIERCDGAETTTQAMLGEIITRPKLSEKLLSKPPFRFLFDIVLEVIKVTGFASTLYTPSEVDPANVTEKTQKLSFLEKIIKLVGVQMNTMIQAKPLRIIGGYDPQNTNNFLQLLSIAAKHMPDSRNAVRAVLEQGAEGGDIAPTPVATAPVREIKKEEEPKPKRVELAEPKERERERAVIGAGGKSVDDRREVIGGESAPTEDGDGDGDAGDLKRSARPTTARRRPPKVKEGAKEVTGRDIAPVGKKTQGIMADGQVDDDEDEGVPEEKRLADDVKADSKAATGDVQSKLVKDIMSRQAEQEAARKASVEQKEAADEKKEEDVRGIRIGKLRKTGTEKSGKTAVGSGNFGEGDMERLRAAIQVLVQHTGPLGTCMDYVQEDISLMTGELHKWGEECRKYEGEMEVEKKKSADLLRPLQVEFAELEELLLEQKAKISSTKASIARNDERIQQILKLVATS